MNVSEPVFKTSWLDTTNFADISRQVGACLISAQPFPDWSGCRQTLLDLLAVDESWMHVLPLIACMAVGGKAEQALPVAASWTSLRHAANLIDDVQDGDLQGYPHPVSPGIAITYALAFIFSGFQILNDHQISPEKIQKISSIFARSGLDSVQGQFSDLSIEEKILQTDDILQSYWMTVIQKSGSIYFAGLAGGAAVGTDSEELVETLGKFGIAIGVIRQVIDDCRDILVDSTAGHNKSTLPMILQAMIQSESGSQSVNLSEIIGDILEEWKRRALMSLEIVESSPAKDGLLSILEHVLHSHSTN